MSLYREPFHLKSSLVKPPAVELATSRWYEMVMSIHTIWSPTFLTAVFNRFFSDNFRLVFLGISSSLGKGSSGSGENITSQNRWRDYPTAWWNHQTPWKKLSNSRVCRAPPWGENSWNRVWNHKFFPRSPIHKIVGDFGNKMLDILKIRQDATVCRSEQFPIFWPAGILKVGFGFSILSLMIFEKKWTLISLLHNPNLLWND